MNRTERIIYETERSFQEEEKNMLYEVIYYDDENFQNGKICNDFDETIDFVSKLIGYRHINILRFDRTEL